MLTNVDRSDTENVMEYFRLITTTISLVIVLQLKSLIPTVKKVYDQHKNFLPNTPVFYL